MIRMLRALAALCALALAAGSAGGVILHGTDNVDDALYRIDTADGSYVLVGNYTLNDPAGEYLIGGLAYDGDLDLFYGISSGNFARLYTIDPNTAATTDVGPLGVGFVFEGGLCFDPTAGILYGVNEGWDMMPHLFTVNTSTGHGAIVGQIGGGQHDFGGLAFDIAGQLYGLDRVANALWKIDKNDPYGAGTVQVGVGLGGGISMGSSGGMASDADGVVYGYASGSKDLFTVDLSVGTGTLIHTYSVSDPTFYSLGFSTVTSPVRPTSWGGLKRMFAE